jgi:hypothetical protein
LTFGDTELQSRIHLSRFHANLFYCAVQYIVGTRICLSTMTQPSTIVWASSFSKRHSQCPPRFRI